jgi:hypothetical protein
MKNLNMLALIGVVVCATVILSLSVKASSNIETLCEDKGISYNLVETVAKYSSYSEEELVDIFAGYADDSDTEDEVDIVDAIAGVVGCDEDKALEIITEADNM